MKKDTIDAFRILAIVSFGLSIFLLYMAIWLEFVTIGRLWLSFVATFILSVGAALCQWTDDVPTQEVKCPNCKTTLTVSVKEPGGD